MVNNEANSFPEQSSPIIRIPGMDKDTRVGSAFGSIFDIIFRTEEIISKGEDRAIWDFTGCHYFHPSFIGALGILKAQYSDLILLQGISDDLSDYLESIGFCSPLKIDTEESNIIFQSYKNSKEYLPLCIFNPMDKSSIRIQELVQDAIGIELGLGKVFRNILSLLLAELIDNITEHSKGKNGFLFCYNRSDEKIFYVMVSDTGRSIYSSYASDKRYENILTNMESSGLLLALRGKSTKDRPENENRGYGISRSRKLVVDGLGGRFFILSGNSFARHDINGEAIADLPGNIRWNGTAIFLEIPTDIPVNFNIYNYIS